LYAMAHYTYYDFLYTAMGQVQLATIHMVSHAL